MNECCVFVKAFKMRAHVLKLYFFKVFIFNFVFLKIIVYFENVDVDGGTTIHNLCMYNASFQCFVYKFVYISCDFFRIRIFLFFRRVKKVFFLLSRVADDNDV